MPKSPLAALPTKVANCAMNDWSRPRRERSSSRCDWVACSFSISSTGSPTKRKIMKAMKLTDSITKMAFAARLIRNASIRAPGWKDGQRDGAAPVLQGGLFRDVPEPRLVVRELGEILEAGPDGPGNELLVQRQHHDSVLGDLQRLGLHRQPLFAVQLDGGRIGEPVNLRIAPAAPVEDAGISTLAVQHLDEDGIGVEHRLVCPADRVDIGLAVRALRCLLCG